MNDLVISDFKLIPVENLPATHAGYADIDDDIYDDAGESFTPRPKLSIKGRQFTEINTDGWATSIETFKYPCVILGVTPRGSKSYSKAWFKERYKETDEPRLPDCYSDDGVKPSTFVESPVCASCITCPKNALGTSVSEDGELGGGKACADMKTVYFLKATSPEDLDGEVWSVRVKYTSAKMLSKYYKTLKKHRVLPHGVITAMSFVKGVAYPQLEFSSVGVLPQPLALKVAKRRDEESELLTTGTSLREDFAPEASTPEPEKSVTSIVVEDIEDLDVDDLPSGKVERVVDIPEAVEVVEEPHAVEVPEPPAVDSAGMPWDKRIHASSKALVADGTWRKRRGVADDVVAKVEAELKPTERVEAPSSVFEATHVAESKDELEGLLDELGF